MPAKRVPAQPHRQTPEGENGELKLCNVILRSRCEFPFADSFSGWSSFCRQHRPNLCNGSTYQVEEILSSGSTLFASLLALREQPRQCFRPPKSLVRHCDECWGIHPLTTGKTTNSHVIVSQQETGCSQCPAGSERFCRKIARPIVGVGGMLLFSVEPK